jgi:hypothetical protein
MSLARLCGKRNNTGGDLCFVSVNHECLQFSEDMGNWPENMLLYTLTAYIGTKFALWAKTFGTVVV